RTDRVGDSPAGAGQALRRRRQANRIGGGDYRARRDDAADAGAVRLPPPRPPGAPADRSLCRHRRHPAHGRRAAGRRYSGAGCAVSANRGCRSVTAAVFAALLATGVLYLWYGHRTRRLADQRLAAMIAPASGIQEAEAGEAPRRTI